MIIHVPLKEKYLTFLKNYSFVFLIVLGQLKQKWSTNTSIIVILIAGILILVILNCTMYDVSGTFTYITTIIKKINKSINP